MNFKYNIIVTKTIPIPNGDRQYDYVYLTNNPNFIEDRLISKDSTNINKKLFKKNQWIQFYNGTHHIDAVRYSNNISLQDKTRDIFAYKYRQMTRNEIVDKYRHDYILDI